MVALAASSHPFWRLVERGVAWRIVTVQYPIVENFFSNVSNPVVQPFQYLSVKVFFDCLFFGHNFTANHTFLVKKHNDRLLDWRFTHPYFFRTRRSLSVPFTALTLWFTIILKKPHLTLYYHSGQKLYISYVMFRKFPGTFILILRTFRTIFALLKNLVYVFLYEGAVGTCARGVTLHQQLPGIRLVSKLRSAKHLSPWISGSPNRLQKNFVGSFGTDLVYGCVLS